MPRAPSSSHGHDSKPNTTHEPGTVKLMQSLQLDVFSELARWSDGPCVSLYLPLDPKHPSIEADRVLLKDLVGDAATNWSRPRGCGVRRSTTCSNRSRHCSPPTGGRSAAAGTRCSMRPAGRRSCISMRMAHPRRRRRPVRRHRSSPPCRTRGASTCWPSARTVFVSTEVGARASSKSRCLISRPAAPRHCRTSTTSDSSARTGGSHHDVDRIAGTIHGSPY